MLTKVVFQRNEGLKIDAMVVVNFESEETSPAVLVSKLKAAVTTWVKTTEEGANALSQSDFDFNIGDLLHHECSEWLNRFLSARGITGIKFDVVTVPEVLEYDMGLIDDSELTQEDRERKFLHACGFDLSHGFMSDDVTSVSYTHLTLPTIYSV